MKFGDRYWSQTGGWAPLADSISYRKAATASVAHTPVLGHGAGLQLLGQEGSWAGATGEGRNSPTIPNTNHSQLHWLVDY